MSETKTVDSEWDGSEAELAARESVPQRTPLPRFLVYDYDKRQTSPRFTDTLQEWNGTSENCDVVVDLWTGKRKAHGDWDLIDGAPEIVPSKSAPDAPYTTKDIIAAILDESKEPRNRLQTVYAMLTASAAPEVQRVALSDEERGAIEAAVNLIRAVYDALDDSEENGGGTLHLDRSHVDAIEGAMVELDSLPDDRPNTAMGPAAKFAWALRRVYFPKEEPSGRGGE